MSDMETYRAEIDRVDGALLRLFEERMQIARAIGTYKASHGMPVFDAAREEEKIRSVRAQASPGAEDEAESFFRALMAISRGAQDALSGGGTREDGGAL